MHVRSRVFVAATAAATWFATSAGAARAAGYEIHELDTDDPHDQTWANHVDNEGRIAGGASRDEDNTELDRSVKWIDGHAHVVARGWGTGFVNGGDLVGYISFPYGSGTAYEGYDGRRPLGGVVVTGGFGQTYFGAMLAGGSVNPFVGTRYLPRFAGVAGAVVEDCNGPGACVGFATTDPRYVEVGLSWSSTTSAPTPLPMLHGPAVPRAINDPGVIVGECTDYTDGSGTPHYRPCRWQNGHVTGMPTFGGPYGGAQDVNDAGTIVGWADAHTNDPRAFVSVDGGNPIDLNTLIAHPTGDHWLLQCANGINNQGWIVGYGTHNGKRRGFVLKPKNTPLAVDHYDPIAVFQGAALPRRLLGAKLSPVPRPAPR